MDLGKERIDEIRRSITDKRKDIISFQAGGDSLDNAKKVEYTTSLNNLNKSLLEHQNVLCRLKSVKLLDTDIISFGSLFTIKNMESGISRIYFITCVGGKNVIVDEETVSTMSLGAPFAQSLIDKKENDEISFREMTFKILSVQ